LIINWEEQVSSELAGGYCFALILCAF